MWFPLVRELPGKAVSFHLLPLTEAYRCLVVMGITEGWLALVRTQAAPRGGRCPGPALSTWRYDTWVTAAIQ